MLPQNLPSQAIITKAVRQKLRSEIERTGVTALMLLKNEPDMPEGLTVAHVNRWLSGLIDKAPQSHLEYVTSKWAKLPEDAERIGLDGAALPKRGKRFSDGARRIELTEDMAVLLRAELARTALDHGTLLDGLENVPDGLNARIIRGWLYRDTKSTNEQYWQFVLAHLKAAPDFTGSLHVPIRKPRKCHNLGSRPS